MVVIFFFSIKVVFIVVLIFIGCCVVIFMLIVKLLVFDEGFSVSSLGRVLFLMFWKVISMLLVSVVL